MALTDTAVRQAKPSAKDYTLKDSCGLALFVGPKGANQWHFRIYWLCKQARLSLGVYPAASLKEARTTRDEARALVAQGVDPRANRREARLAASAVGLLRRTSQYITFIVEMGLSFCDCEVFRKGMSEVVGRSVRVLFR